MANTTTTSTTSTNTPASATGSTNSNQTAVQGTNNSGNSGAVKGTNAGVSANSTKPDTGTKPVEVKPDAQTGERKFKLDDGSEVTETELKKVYKDRQEHIRSANAKMQEAAKLKKNMELVAQMAKTNPRAFLSDPMIGVDLKKFAEEYLMDQYNDEVMQKQDPEKFNAMKKAKELEAELATIKAAKEAKETEEARIKTEAEVQHWMNHYIQDIDNAIASSKSLPQKNKAVYERVVHYMTLGNDPNYVEKNGRGVTAVDVLPLVERDFKDWTKSLYADLSPEQLLEYLGEDIAKKIRKEDIKRLKNPIKEPKSDRPRFSKKDDKNKTRSIDEFKAELRKRDKEKGLI